MSIRYLGPSTREASSCEPLGVRLRGLAIGSLFVVVCMGCTRYIVGADRHEPARDAGTRRDSGDAGFDPRADSGSGPTTDAGAGADAGSIAPAGFFFSQPFAEPLSIELDGSPREGTALRLRLRFAMTQTCDSFGHVAVFLDPTARVATVQPWIWRELEVPCAPARRVLEVSRTVFGLTAGDWTVVHDGGRLSLSVMPAAAISACDIRAPEGDPCDADCGCEAGLACIEPRDTSRRICGRPCEVTSADDPWNASCDPTRECVRDAIHGSVCRPRSAPACGGDVACASGMACWGGLCDWEPSSIGPVHAPCLVDAECGAGRDCVGWMGADPSLRRCEIRCTSSDMRCPDGTTGACAAQGVCDPFP